MIDTLETVEYIFQLPLKWFKSVAVSINKMRGDVGITVDNTGDYPIVKLGDQNFQFRPIDCVKPTYTDGNLTSLEFYQVSAFCAVAKINSSTVSVDECECVAP